MNKDTILITGATGFVGSWMTRYLLDQGHKVKILRRQNSDLTELKGLDVEHCIGDVTDLASIEVASKNVDAIFHLAGFIGYSKKMKPLMESINVGGTKNIVEICKKNKNIKRLLYFSSVVAVGAGFHENEILNESSTYNVGHLNLGYFETKKKAEEVVLKACKDNQIHAVIVNPATIYGPGDARKGSRKNQLKVYQGKLPFYTSGGVNIISIHDVVKAAYKAYEIGPNGERYILAGENITIKKLFEIISELAGVKPPSIHLPNFIVRNFGKIGDLLEKLNIDFPLTSETVWTSTLFHWFDSKKAKDELDLNPKSAKEAISESIHWIKENLVLND